MYLFSLNSHESFISLFLPGTSFNLEGYSSASKLCSPYVGFVVAVVVVVAAAAAVAVAAIEDQFELDMIF